MEQDDLEENFEATLMYGEVNRSRGGFQPRPLQQS